MIRQNRFSLSVNDGSTATLSVAIPGTFATLNPKDPTFSGRAISEVVMEFGSPAAGDYCAGFSVVDQNGVIPSGERAAFPDYPVLFSWNDPDVPSENQGLYLPTDAPARICPQENNGLVASGLVLQATFGKAAGLTSDTLYCTVTWDDLQALQT